MLLTSTFSQSHQHCPGPTRMRGVLSVKRARFSGSVEQGQEARKAVTSAFAPSRCVQVVGTTPRCRYIHRALSGCFIPFCLHVKKQLRGVNLAVFLYFFCTHIPLGNSIHVLRHWRSSIHKYRTASPRMHNRQSSKHTLSHTHSALLDNAIRVLSQCTGGMIQLFLLLARAMHAIKQHSGRN